MARFENIYRPLAPVHQPEYDKHYSVTIAEYLRNDRRYQGCMVWLRQSQITAFDTSGVSPRFIRVHFADGESTVVELNTVVHVYCQSGTR